MNTVPANVSNLWFITGWTMIHFLWLGAIVAAAALACRALLRRASANLRYAAALTSLIVLAALPPMTAVWLAKYYPSDTVAVGSTAPTAIDRAEDSPSLGVASAAPGSAGGSLAAPLQNSVSIPLPMPENRRQSQGLPADTVAATPTKVTDVLNAFIPYLPWVWLIGTPLTFALLVSGVVGTRRLSRASRVIENDPILELLAHLAASLRISRRVAIAVCDRIASPVLIGVVRPMILLPPAALTGWSPDEIEMVLLHELAHVRRWDNLVNLLQRCLESLLFFHPAVWLLSAWARSEREACCDATVVSRTNRPHAYAELLVALAAQLPRSVLFHPAATSAMAAGPLRSRIRQILKVEDDSMLITGKSLAIMLGSMIVAAALIVLYVPAIGHADSKEPAAKVTSVATALDEYRKTIVTYDLGFDSVFPQQPWTANDPDRLKRYPTADAWPNVLGHVDIDAGGFRSVREKPSSSHENVSGPNAYLVPLSWSIGTKNYATLLFLEGVAKDAHVVANSYTSLACFGPMAGDAVFSSYATALVDGEMSGQITANSYFDLVVTGKMSGQITTQSYAMIYLMGGFTGQLELKHSRVYIAGNTSKADLTRIKGAGQIYLEESDLRAGNQIIGELEVHVKKSISPGDANDGKDTADGKTVTKSGEVDEPEILQFTLRRTGAGEVNLLVNGKAINDDQLDELIPSDSKLLDRYIVSVKADAGVPYGEVMKFVDKLESAGVKKLSLDTRNVSSESEKFPYVVPFEKGASQFLDGDEITIEEVRGTAKEIKPGNNYQVKGKYKLHSHASASISAYTTAKEAKDGYGRDQSVQTKNISQGEGDFTLILPMSVPGWPHISFYSGGPDIGGVYFGTGDSVLKEWWGSEKKEKDGSANFATKNDYPYEVHFEKGVSKFLPGDDIAISEIRGTAKEFKPGNNYQIKGKYKLHSHPGAQLSAFTTAREAKDGTGPVQSIQTQKISGGDADFTIILPMTIRGWPHVSFYGLNDGEGFGGIYFGTGETVLKEWWGSEKPAKNKLEEMMKLVSDAQQRKWDLEAKLRDDPHDEARMQQYKQARKSLDDQLRLLQEKLSDETAKEAAEDAQANQPTQNSDDWPMGVIFPSPKEGDISAAAWRQLGIKVVHAPTNESDQQGHTLKVVGGIPIPAGNAAPILLLSLNGIETKTFDELASALEKVKGKPMVVAKCSTSAGGTEMRIEAALANSDRPAAAKSAGLQTSPPNSTAEPRPNSKFPSLEQQKLADVAYKQIDLELEPLGESDLKRVKALGYDGGVKVVAGKAGIGSTIDTDDILVGLHVWPTTNMSDVVQILNRQDLDDLNPLKYYVVRHGTNNPDGSDKVVEFDGVATGRIQVKLPQHQSPYGSTYLNADPAANQAYESVNSPASTTLSNPVLQVPVVQSLSQPRQQQQPQPQPAANSDRYSASVPAPAAVARTKTPSASTVAALTEEAKRLADAMQRKEEAMEKRLAAKTDKEVEISKRDLDAANKKLEEAKHRLEGAKRQFEDEKREQEKGEPKKQLKDFDRRSPQSTSTTLSAGTAWPSVGKELGNTASSQWPSARSAASPEEIEILSDRVKSIEAQNQFITERFKAGKGATQFEVMRAGIDLNVAKSDLALAEDHREAAIDKLQDALKLAEDVLQAEQASARAGIASPDVEGIAKATQSLSDIKLKLIRLKHEGWRPNSNDAWGQRPVEPKLEQSYERKADGQSSGDVPSPAGLVTAPIKPGPDLTSSDGKVLHTVITQRTALDGRPVYETSTAPGEIAAPESHPNGESELKTRATSVKPDLLYDGKSFIQWKASWFGANQKVTRDLSTLYALEAFAAVDDTRAAANEAIAYGLYADRPVPQRVREYLHTLPKTDAEPIVDGFLNVLKTDLSTTRRVQAIRGIAAIGPNAESALPELKVALAKKNEQERIAAATAIKMIVGKDQYQKPIADVLGEELQIKVEKTPDGKWGALPRDENSTADAFNDFTAKVIDEQDRLYSADYNKQLK